MNPLLNIMSKSMSTGSNPSQDMPTQHGFFMLGTSTVFLYHSAQFTMENHSYQMVFTAGLSEGIMKEYIDDVAQYGSGGWVWVFVNGVGNNPPANQLFTLPQIQTGQVTSLTGSIIRISTTDPSTSVVVVPAATISVARLIYYRHFDTTEAYNSPLTYVLFGDSSGAWIAHYLTKLKDFDNLAQLEQLPAWLDPTQLAASLSINFPSVPYEPGQIPAQSPLQANTTYPVLFGGVSDPTFTVNIQSIYWFDTTVVNAPA